MKPMTWDCGDPGAPLRSGGLILRGPAPAHWHAPGGPRNGAEGRVNGETWSWLSVVPSWRGTRFTLSEGSCVWSDEGMAGMDTGGEEIAPPLVRGTVLLLIREIVSCHCYGATVLPLVGTWTLCIHCTSELQCSGYGHNPRCVFPWVVAWWPVVKLGREGWTGSPRGFGRVLWNVGILWFVLISWTNVESSLQSMAFPPRPCDLGHLWEKSPISVVMITRTITVAIPYWALIDVLGTTWLMGRLSFNFHLYPACAAAENIPCEMFRALQLWWQDLHGAWVWCQKFLQVSAVRLRHGVLMGVVHFSRHQREQWIVPWSLPLLGRSCPGR